MRIPIDLAGCRWPVVLYGALPAALGGITAALARQGLLPSPCSLLAAVVTVREVVYNGTVSSTGVGPLPWRAVSGRGQWQAVGCATQRALPPVWGGEAEGGLCNRRERRADWF